jgi:hypothetical protein
VHTKELVYFPFPLFFFFDFFSCLAATPRIPCHYAGPEAKVRVPGFNIEPGEIALLC